LTVLLSPQVLGELGDSELGDLVLEDWELEESSQALGALEVRAAVESMSGLCVTDRQTEQTLSFLPETPVQPFPAGDSRGGRRTWQSQHGASKLGILGRPGEMVDHTI
jgi:hypothetical protein